MEESSGLRFEHAVDFTFIKRDLFKAYCCLGGICIIWGTTFLAMRIGVANFPPFLFAGIRQFCAGSILCSFLILVRKLQLPSFKVVVTQAFAGFLMITMGNGLVSWGEVYVPSGLAAIICSTMPLWVTLINVAILKVEKPNARVIIGLAVGLGGILLIFSEHLSEFTEINYRVGIILIVLASVGWAVGSILIKRNKQQSDPFLNAGLQMFFGGIFCFICSFAVDDLSNVQWSMPAMFSLLYLILIGSTLAFALYTYVLMKLPITIASLYSYVNPIVAVILGWIVLSEKLNLKIWIAITIVIAGIWLVNRAYKAKEVKN